MGIIFTLIINRINYLSENVLCSKNDETGTEIYLKSLRAKKENIKSNTFGLVKKIKRTLSSNAIKTTKFKLQTQFHNRNLSSRSKCWKTQKRQIVTLSFLKFVSFYHFSVLEDFRISEIFFEILHTKILFDSGKGVFCFYQKGKR